MFHLTEHRLTILSKNIRNTPSIHILNDGIKVDIRTAEQFRESPPDTALAASHESRQ